MVTFAHCPFCGSDDALVQREPAQIPQRAEIGHGRFFVTCVGCASRGPWLEGIDGQQTLKDVISKWNERAQKKSVQ